MLYNRVIPCLLLSRSGLVKTVLFKDPRYVGDPINTVRIFNEKQVDEMIFLDIDATRRNQGLPIRMLSDIAGQCFMPLAYGGGIRSIGDIEEVMRIGVEKVVINTSSVERPLFIDEASQTFGSQSIIVSIDVKKNLFGRYRVYTHNGTKDTGLDPVEHAIDMQGRGAGELFINSIDHDGTMKGYDLDIIGRISNLVNIPVIACGGAGSTEDLSRGLNAGAAAVSAGSLFVFYGRLRAVLINYPSREEIESICRS